MKTLAHIAAALVLSWGFAAQSQAFSFLFANPGGVCPTNVVGCTDGANVDLTSNNSQNPNVFVYQDGGVTLTVASGDQGILIQDRVPDEGGLGVLANEDNVETGESVVLAFDKRVRIALAFTDHGAVMGDYGYQIDGGMTVVDQLEAPDMLEGMSFVILARDVPFYIAAIEGEVVPEPGTAMLLGLGLTGLAASKRRRSA